MKKNSKNNKREPHNDKIQILRMLLITLIIIIAMHFGYNINMSINPATSEYIFNFALDRQDRNNTEDNSVVEDQADLFSTIKMDD